MGEESRIESLDVTTPEDPDIAWGDAQIGRYVFRRFVGSGGMGVVIAAHDPELDREVAIKIVATEDDSDEARPLREAQAMARLSHPNVVQVYEVMRLGAKTAIVMELVEGEDLGAWRRREERPWRAVVAAYVQAGRGLAAAHRAGIVHRDFKPSNALIDGDGVVRVTDFGLARRASGDVTTGDDAEDASGRAGTPAYMAPEQHRREAASARTDQWALACSLYEGLHGTRPFVAADREALADAVLGGDLANEPPGSPVPRRIRAAIRRALATDPDDRFASVDDFVAAISEAPRQFHYLAGAAIGLALVVSVSMLVARRAPSPCAELDAPIRALWTDQARMTLRGRLATQAVGLPATAIDRALHGLDEYATTWKSARSRTCLDTQQGIRSAAALDTRMRCLDRRLAEMSGVLEGLAIDDPATLRAAADAVTQLPAIAGCDDVKETDARPANPALRSELDGAEDALARAAAFLSLGQFERSLPLVDRAVAAGEHASSPSLVARALLIRGECENRLGHYPEALATYQRAAKAGATARDQTLVADALARAFLVDGDHLGHRADALRTQPFVELALESAGQPASQRAEWLHFLAILLYDDPTRVEEAATHERESLAIRERTLPPGHVYIVDSLETLANIEAAQKHFDESKRRLQQVLAARLAARGPNDSSVSAAYNNLAVLEIRRDHLLPALEYLEQSVATARSAGRPNTAALFNLAVTQYELGRWSASARSYSFALETMERVPGPESRGYAEAAIFLGVTWIALGDQTRGRPMLLRGVELARRSGSPSLATALSHAARVALHDGGDRPSARALLDEASRLPITNAPLLALVKAELVRDEGGCATGRGPLAEALAAAVADGEQAMKSIAAVELAQCEIAAGDVAAAGTRLEAELAWLAKAGADDLAIAPARAALARARR